MRHDAGMDAPHHDVDILLGEQTLSKSGQLSVDLPLLLIATLCLLLLRPKRRESFVLLVATDHREIGRASCRERVCQYVSISVVAVSLTNKTARTSTKQSH